MKIDCGPTEKERREMRNLAAALAKQARMQWHDYFAWKPVRLGSHDCRWLETIERRAVEVNYYDWYAEEWVYRAKEKV